VEQLNFLVEATAAAAAAAESGEIAAVVVALRAIDGWEAAIYG
jgi:hypothetical protein